MNNVIILGASGNVVSDVINILAEKDEINLTLFLRKKNKLKNIEVSKCNIIVGDVLNLNQLQAAMRGQDIVYSNLGGDQVEMAMNIVQAMYREGVKRLIFTSTIGIYDLPLRRAFFPFRKAAGVIEESDLEYTILRPACLTSVNEIDYEITHNKTVEKGSFISQKSLATFITKIIEHPEMYVRENLGINKPKSGKYERYSV